MLFLYLIPKASTPHTITHSHSHSHSLAFLFSTLSTSHPQQSLSSHDHPLTLTLSSTRPHMITHSPSHYHPLVLTRSPTHPHTISTRPHTITHSSSHNHPLTLTQSPTHPHTITHSPSHYNSLTLTYPTLLFSYHCTTHNYNTILLIVTINIVLTPNDNAKISLVHLHGLVLPWQVALFRAPDAITLSAGRRGKEERQQGREEK